MDAYSFLLGVFAFLFGAIAGSFINALLSRLGTGKGMGGRSRCMTCGKTLNALDLVPILSFVFLRGRCRHCRSRIAISYALIEILAGALALGVYLTAQGTLEFFSGALIWLILLAIAVYDLRHLIIPDSFVAALCGLSLASLFFAEGSFVLPSLWSLAAGPALALPLFLLWLMSRGRWMGLGDPKLMLGLGWFLGAVQGAFALMLAFYIGALVSLVILVATFEKGGKGLTMKSEVPFGPFLILGAAAVYFTDITHVLLAAIIP